MLLFFAKGDLSCEAATAFARGKTVFETDAKLQGIPSAFRVTNFIIENQTGAK